MSQPFVGEIRMFGGNFAPAGWMFCSGQLLSISENETLFQLIGTTYGGDGQSTFGLPDLQGRVPLHTGQGPGLQNYQMAETGGVETVTLTANQLPGHSHAVQTAATGQTASPAGAILADATSVQAGGRTYNAAVVPLAPMHAGSVGGAGGSQPHDNLQPTVAISFIISLFGIFPSPS